MNCLGFVYCILRTDQCLRFSEHWSKRLTDYVEMAKIRYDILVGTVGGR